MLFLFAIFLASCSSRFVLESEVPQNYSSILNSTITSYISERHSVGKRTPLTGAKVSVMYSTPPGLVITRSHGTFSVVQHANATKWYMNMVWVFYPNPYGYAAGGQFGYYQDANGNFFKYVQVTGYAGPVYVLPDSGTTYTIVGTTVTITRQITAPYSPSTNYFETVGSYTYIDGLPPALILNRYSFNDLGVIILSQEATFGYLETVSEFYGSGYTCSTYPKTEVRWDEMHAYLTFPARMTYVGPYTTPTCGTYSTQAYGTYNNGAVMVLEGA